MSDVRNQLIEDHKKGFITLKEIGYAAYFWGVDEHTAEQRLLKGELPE